MLKKIKDDMRMFSFKMRETQRKALEKASEKTNRSMSELMDMALDEFFLKHKGEL